MSSDDAGSPAPEGWRPPYLGCFLALVLIGVGGAYAFKQANSTGRSDSQLSASQEPRVTRQGALSVSFSAQGALYLVDEVGQPWRVRSGVPQKTIVTKARGPYDAAAATPVSAVLVREGGGLDVLNLRSGEAVGVEHDELSFTLCALAEEREAFVVSYAVASVTSDSVFYTSGVPELPSWTRSSGRGVCRSLALSDDLVAAGSAQGHVTLLDRASGGVVRTLRAPGRSEAVVALAFHPDGTRIAAALEKGFVIWSVKDEVPALVSQVFTSRLTAIGLSEGSLLAVGTAGGDLSLFDLGSPQTELRTFSLDLRGESIVEPRPVRSIAFSGLKVAWAIGDRFCTYEFPVDPSPAGGR